ncbi:sulfate reduction electron transfer complex DsrMKJOP subunit DsrO [Dethiosulfatarculus sandiegensis]|uniref:4Fe-4S ferredoxin n=1 Tax=Dethiosulfatarculus sandiegensis TaxID=1429043 RepID=A0A0D2J5T5_9BACT|nr:4Fe-4S dicluster domain-containing protein [Dethiosulfatarculus sandiegensis]KIX13464.1 4Fe-4S ferredoxin [Dethiosulfatarculus sandiegensis]
MEFGRRIFLKRAGILAAFGITSAAGFELFKPGELDAAEVLPAPDRFRGKHWGMVIDTRKFHGEADVKPIIDACNKAHNVPHIENNQNIKWIWSTGFHNAFTDQENEFLEEKLENTPVLVLCNHCENPPCVRACPTKATFQRAEDGIVLMDFHRCIGCRFCMAACPYGSRSFNFADPRKFLPEKLSNPEFPTRTKGVVEKCNFCAERLAKGQIPACVEAAKDDALIFGDLADERSPIRKALRENYSIRRKPSLGTNPSVYYLV